MSLMKGANASVFAAKVAEAVDRRRYEIIDFVRELIRTPSSTGKEKDVAAVLTQRMRAEGFSEIMVDLWGNVVGTIKGQGKGVSLLYNGHMDHVPPGEMKAPYSARVLDGRDFGVEGEVIYGRGACDMKGSLGAMVMAGSVIRDLDLDLKGDLIVTGTVFEEEPGSVGPPALVDVDRLEPDAALVGEPTNLDLAHGNRGVVRTKLITHGRSCHVSVQEQGVNALYKMARVIERIQRKNDSLPSHPILGRSSWGVCKIEVTPNIVNVVPSRCEIEIDTRTIPDFTPEMIVDEQRGMIDELAKDDSELKAEVLFEEREIVTWTGHNAKAKPMTIPFYAEPNHWLAKAGRESVRQVRGREPSLKIWGFTTECSCFTERGIPTVGFGPGEERFAHSNKEVLSVEDLIMATKVYTLLAANVCLRRDLNWESKNT